MTAYFKSSKVTFLVVADCSNLDLSMQCLNKNIPKHVSFVGLSSREDFTPIETEAGFFKAAPPLQPFEDISYLVCPGGAFKYHTLLQEFEMYALKGIQKKLYIDENTVLITAADLTCEQGVSDFYGRFKKICIDELQKRMRDRTVFLGARVAKARQSIEQTRCPRLSRHDEFLKNMCDVKSLIKAELKKNHSGLIIVNNHSSQVLENSFGMALHECGLSFSDVHAVYATTDSGISEISF